MNIYFIPGFGADERLFKGIHLPGHDLHFLHWLEPHKHETIQHYSGRIAEKIDTSKPFAIIGMSFGGIMAIEASKHIQPQHIILISSLKTKYEMPFILRFVRMFGLYKLPPAFVRRCGFLLSFFLGGLNNTDYKLVMDMFNKSSDAELLWSAREVVTWKNTYIPPNLTHIHGDKDIVIPIKYVKNVIRIHGGTHFMVVRKAKTISKIIMEALRVQSLV